MPIIGGGVTQYERRFKGLKKIIRDTNIVGYITDQEIEEMLGDINTTSRFYLTQYALSPVIVNNSLEHDFIIDNFHSPISNYEDFEDKGLIVLRDFGGGVILFKHRVK